MSLYWALALTLTISITTFRTIGSFPSRHNRQCPQFNPFCTNVAFENGCYICNPVSNIGTSSSSNSNSGTNRSPTGELLCDPYPSMCLPMYIQLDDNDCPVCTMNGGAQNPFHQAASNINNCPPIQWNCPTLHIDRNGCPLCGSKAPTANSPSATIPTILKQSSTNRQNSPPPKKSPTYRTQTSNIISRPTQLQASKQQSTQQVPTKSKTSSQTLLSTTKTSKPVKATSTYVPSTATSSATKSSSKLKSTATRSPTQLVTMPTKASTQPKVTSTNQPSGTNSYSITASIIPTLITSTSKIFLTRSKTTPKIATPIPLTKSKTAPTVASSPMDSSATKTMSTSASPPIPTATPRPIPSTQLSTTLTTSKTKPLLSTFPQVRPTKSSTSIPTRTTLQNTHSIQALSTPKSLRPGALITNRNNTSIYTRSLASIPFTVQTQTSIAITNTTTALRVKTSALPTRRSSKATTTVFNCLPFPADCPQLPGCFSFDSNSCMVCTCTRTTTPASTTCATLQCLLDCQGKPLKKDARGCDLCLCET